MVATGAFVGHRCGRVPSVSTHLRLALAHVSGFRWPWLAGRVCRALPIGAPSTPPASRPRALPTLRGGAEGMMWGAGNERYFGGRSWLTWQMPGRNSDRR